MTDNKNTYEHIDKSKFVFTQMDAALRDSKLETKSRSYLADAMLRFRKNKSSVVGAFIIAFLLIFALLSPIISPYTIAQKDRIYTSYPPYIEAIAQKHWGIFDGATTRTSQNEKSMLYWRGIAEETGRDPVLKVLGTVTTQTTHRGKTVDIYSYNIETNKYYEKGIMYLVFSYEEFERIQAWQDENDIQVIYPYVDPKDIAGITDNPNLWYQVDSAGAAKLDKDGNFVPVYCTNKAIEGAPYHSKRIEGDDGSYIYSSAKSGAVQCRVDYYNYYHYIYGHVPFYIFGSNSMGQDLFMAIGVGARFSIIFAIVVASINLFIGAIIGAIEGYFGGAIDMTIQRICEILGGIPFVVVATLFQLHLAQKVGIVPSFLFAFVMTGWIGMANLTRRQFYRFKGQEFVMAARTLGASDRRLMFKHIFPNAIGTIITSVALVIPGVIGSETNLTYLGIINLSDFAGTSIGTLMSQGQATMTAAPHTIFFPALFISLLLISFNLFGNGLRDAFNPTTRGEDD